MNYNITKATLLNLDEIFNLQKNSSHELVSYTSLNNDLNSDNKTYFIIKNENEELVGFIGISNLIDHVDIDCIFTKSTYRRAHIASSLLEFVIDYCKNNNIEKIFLEVRISNTPAISLYEKYNFKNISTRKKYYSDNKEDALIYMLKI